MTVNLKTIPTPAIGSDAHSVSSLQQMLAVITANFTELKNAVDTVNATIAAQPTEYLSTTVPDEAKVGDKWYKADNADLTQADSIEGYVCKQAYTAGEGLTTEQKEARWKAAKDAETQATVASLTSLLDGKASLYQSSDPPAAMDAGDIWIDTTTVSGINQAYVAISDYDYSGSGGIPSGGWTDANITSHFRISGDKAAQAAAADADGIARSKTVNYLRAEMPGISAGDVTAELSVEIGDSWTENVTPYQSYVCYASYDYSEIPVDVGDRATFLTDHWRPKGDKTAQDAATAAQALADSKVTNFRQLTVPVAADVLDTWFKNFAGQDRDELYVCNAAYTEQETNDNYAINGFGTVQAYRESFWDRNYNKDALDAADAAANLANAKTTDWYSNDPPSKAGAYDRWIDRDADPIGQYVIVGAYDYSSKNSVTWVTTGTTDDTGNDVTLVISDFWDKVSQEDEVTNLTDLANKANAYIDGSRVNYMGISPPQSSGISYSNGGVVSERPIDVGDTWVKVDLEQTSNVTGLLSTWVCYRQYQQVVGLTFEGYTAPDRDGNGDLIPVGEVGFNSMNAYNYWVETKDATATEAALDIIALKDGKRATYITDSRAATNGIPNLKAAQGGIQLGDIWIDEGDSFKVFKCQLAYSSDEGTFQGVVIPLYEDKATNWLEVSEPELQAQAILKRSLIDGKRKTFISSAVPNAGGGAPSNWDDITGAQLGDIWIDTSTTPATKYWCSTAYTVGGTTGNWTKNDQVITPVADSDVANKIYVDQAIANLVDTAPATLDTLNELAAALGDDPNFATTVTNSIATVQSAANTAQTAANNAQTAADNAQTTANNAVSAAATAQSTAEDAQTGVTNAIAAITGDKFVNADVFYVNIAGSGDLSGSDASNCLPQTGVRAVIDANPAVVLVFAAGAYTDPFQCSLGASNVAAYIRTQYLAIVTGGGDVSFTNGLGMIGGLLEIYQGSRGDLTTFGDPSQGIEGLILYGVQADLGTDRTHPTLGSLVTPSLSGGRFLAVSGTSVALYVNDASQSFHSFRDWTISGLSALTSIGQLNVANSSGSFVCALNSIVRVTTSLKLGDISGIQLNSCTGAKEVREGAVVSVVGSIANGALTSVAGGAAYTGVA